MTRTPTGTAATLLALLLVVLGVVQAAPARAEQATATLHVSATLGRRVVFEAEPAVASLSPGEALRVAVTLKARVSAGERVDILLVGPASGAPVGYAVGRVSGRLDPATRLGAASGSGVHRFVVTLSLPAGAPRAVSFPLAFRAGAGAALVVKTGTTTVLP